MPTVPVIILLYTAEVGELAPVPLPKGKHVAAASTYRQKFDVILYALQLTNIYQMGGETPQQPAGWWVASTRDPGLLSIWPTDDPSTRVPPVAGLGV